MQGTKMGNEKTAKSGILEMPETDQPLSGAENPGTETQEDLTAVQVSKKAFDKKLEEDKELAATLASRSKLPASGDPNARVSDPHMPAITPRYNIVQNRSVNVLIIPDLKTNVEDMGLVLQPGEYIVLTDFYTPQEINRSKGLRRGATVLKGSGSEYALVPIADEDEAKTYRVPERVKPAPGIPIEDTTPNDFDLRFEELELREAKRDEKLLRKTLGMRRTKIHGSAPANV